MVIAPAGDSVRTVQTDQAGEGRGRSGDRANIEIAFVNNMPRLGLRRDRAAVHRLAEGRGGRDGRHDRAPQPVCAPRAGAKRRGARAALAGTTSPIELIYGSRPDGLIVTGTEPLADDLRAEPYWGALAELIDVGRARDGVRGRSPAWRPTLPPCCSTGSSARRFRQSARGSSSRTIADGPCAHRGSRPDRSTCPTRASTTCPSALLQAGGYTNLDRVPRDELDPGREGTGRCTFVLVQGHPEYSTTSLLREYRRDLQRFLRGERPTCPRSPSAIVDDESRRLLESFEAQRARSAPRSSSS